MFESNRSLLNPKFEGYRLDPISQESVVLRFELEHKPTQVTVSGRSPLSFQEVQSRITHNHIAVASQNGRALYIDAEHKVVVVDMDFEMLQPSFRVVHELPKSLQSPSIDSPHREYPSAAFLTSNVAFVSDGYGFMYVLNIPEAGPATSSGAFELSNPAITGTSDLSPPFRIHNAVEISPGVAVVVLSSRSYVEKAADGGTSKGAMGHAHVEFDVWAVHFDLASIGSSDEVRKLDVLWHRRGDDVPIFTAYDVSRKAFMIIGNSIYRAIGTNAPPTYEPSPDEMAPIPRSEENLDEVGQERPPPYSWTQTSDSVTVAFPLPSSTPKSSLKVTLTPRTLTLHVQGEASTSVPLPHYSMKAFWGGISSSTSFWTWDREAEHTFGLLTLHLDKQHETKWMHVFASAGTSVTSDSLPEDVEVPETLDPSELWKIRESLEKYTSALRDGEDASGLGLGKGIPGLAEGEIDDEVDASVGRPAYVTWIGEDGTKPSWTSNSDETPFTLLSTILPGTQASETSLILKNSLDGTVFSLTPSTDAADPPSWTHTSTFSALAFVLASKRDTRFTYHLPSQAVLAFENGVRDRGGNVYIYRRAPTSDLWAKQAILKVGDGTAGSLLGVGALTSAQGKTIVLCLSEGELIIMHDFL